MDTWTDGCMVGWMASMIDGQTEKLGREASGWLQKLLR